MAEPILPPLQNYGVSGARAPVFVDNESLIVCQADSNTVAIYRIDNGQQLGKLSVGNGSISSLGFFSQRDTFFVDIFPQRLVLNPAIFRSATTLRRIASSSVLNSAYWLAFRHTNNVMGAGLHADGDTVLTCGDRTCKIW